MRLYRSTGIRISSNLRIVFGIVTILSIMCTACQSKNQTAPPPVQWDFEQDAIHLRYDASPDLNQYGGSSHSLMLLVFQLTDAADFTNYTQTPDGILRLLQYHDLDRRKSIDLKNKADLQRFFINPGSSDVLHIDRVKDARWIGVVAGYFDIVPEQSTQVIRIPVEKTEQGFLRKTTHSRPGRLFIDIQLGPRAMHLRKDPS